MQLGTICVVVVKKLKGKDEVKENKSPMLAKVENLNLLIKRYN